MPMPAPQYLKEPDRIAMNEAARDYAWEWYNKGVMAVVDELRATVAEGYRPSLSDLAGLCDIFEAKTKEPR